MYDLRHCAITGLLSDPRVSEETVRSIAGHLSRQMQKRYSHIRLEIRRAAVSVLDGSEWMPAPEPPRLRAEDDLTNESVLKMLQAGLSARIVAQTIKNSQCRFDTSTETLVQLQSAGVSEVVAMGASRMRKRA